MTPHPEHDPELVNNRRQAARFLELLSPSPDHPERPWLDRRDIDHTEPLRASHVFKTVDDVAGRNAPELSKTLTGSLDAHWTALDELNRNRRAGVFVQLDPASAIVAEFIGEPTHGFLMPPSLSVMCGTSNGPDRGILWQCVWLLSGDIQQRDRADVAAMLRTAHGARDVPAAPLVRIPGFHTRHGVSGGTLVQFELPPDCTGAPRYDPAGLWRTFMGKSESEVAATVA